MKADVPMKKALFLDRDGVINVDRCYVSRIEDFEFAEGIFDLCLFAQQKGYLIIVVTNQSGIERGFFTEDDFRVLSEHMSAEFEKRGVSITDIFHCPFLSHEDRKPSPGMFLRAQKKYVIDMAHSVALGDKERDVEAAVKAKVGTSILLSKEKASHFTTPVVASLADVKRYL